MFRFLQKFGRDSQTRRRGTGSLTRARRRNHQLNCEALEGRQLLSGYYIVNAASGKVLDNSLSTSNGTVIDQWQLYGGTNQRWDLVPVGNGNFFIQNEASQLVLDNGLSTSNGTVIDQWQSYGGPNQQWQLTQQPDGNFVIINAYSGQVLDDPAGSTSNGTPLGQYPSNGGANQEWSLYGAGDAPAVTYYVFNDYSFKVLDDPAGSTYNGANIIQYQFNGGANQQWTFVPLTNSNYVIVNAASGLVLDDSGLSDVADRTNIDQWQLHNGALNQQWLIFSQLDGSYAIVNEGNGFGNMVLDDPAGSTDSGTQIIDYQWQGGINYTSGQPNQLWLLYPVSLDTGVDIHGQPSNAVVGQPISPAITVAVVDAKGNTITTNNSQLVTLSIASGLRSAQLLGTTTVRAVDGVADFTNLRLSLPGTYTLTATGVPLTPDFSNVFTIAPATVASHVTIRRGSVNKVGRTGPRGRGGELLAQTITIKNASRQPLGGPLALRVGGLPSGVTLANATGTYEGGSYRDVLAALQPLAPGKSVTVTLDFSMNGRRSPSLSKLGQDLEALLGI